jgi:hypothetical protein
MTEAIFGLVGVVVGGLLTGLMQAWQQWRTARAEMRTGARLISAELSVMAVKLGAYGEGETGRPELPDVVDWPAHRAVLARELKRGDWVTVAQAYALLDMWEGDQAGAAALADHMNAARDTLRGLDADQPRASVARLRSRRRAVSSR